MYSLLSIIDLGNFEMFLLNDEVHPPPPPPPPPSPEKNKKVNLSDRFLVLDVL